MACALAAALLFASCGKEEGQSDGLVSMETAKGYEHIAKLESTPVQNGEGQTPPDSQGGTTVPENTVTPVATPSPDVTSEPEDIVYVAVSKLNLRAAPSLESEVIAQAKYGDSFVRMEKGTEGWDKLLYNGQEVYAFAEYLSDKKVAGVKNMLADAVVADAKKK